MRHQHPLYLEVKYHHYPDFIVNKLDELMPELTTDFQSLPEEYQRVI